MPTTTEYPDPVIRSAELQWQDIFQMSPNYDSFAYDHPISGSGGKAIKITWQLIVWPFLKGRSNTALVTFAADLAGANPGICFGWT